MILDFPGGARPEKRTELGKNRIDIIDSCSAVCIPACEDAAVQAAVGKRVLRGSLIGSNRGTPVYASIAGIFRGIMTLEGGDYFVVMQNGENETEYLYEPETRPLTSLTREDIIESAKRLSVIDSRSGLPLWELLSRINGDLRRIVIDCTEPDPESAVNYRLCIEQAKQIVGGAKILLHATGALKCVFAAEHYRTAAFEAIAAYASDEKIFALAELDEKYPYGDRAIMYALYLKSLSKNQTALDESVLIVAPETAIALYNSMVSGLPQLDRYICVCGNRITRGRNLCVPKGITVHDLLNLCGGMKKGGILIENSLLNGNFASGTLGDGTRALIAVKPAKRTQIECVSCGICAQACPMKLLPNEILSKKAESLIENCIGCGACEYSCPSGIPLLRMIREKEKLQ